LFSHVGSCCFSTIPSNDATKATTTSTTPSYQLLMVSLVVKELEDVGAKLDLKYNPVVAGRAIPASVEPQTPVVQHPAVRGPYNFPPFLGGRQEYHSWRQQLAEYVAVEQPPEMAIYRWLRYELAPKLPVAYQTQLQRAASSAEFSTSYVCKWPRRRRSGCWKWSNGSAKGRCC